MVYVVDEATVANVVGVPLMMPEYAPRETPGGNGGEMEYKVRVMLNIYMAE